MHRTVHILDVISSVSKSSKCTKIVGNLGFAPDPTGERAVFKGSTLRPLLLMERRGGIGVPICQNDLCHRDARDPRASTDSHYPTVVCYYLTMLISGQCRSESADIRPVVLEINYKASDRK